MRRLSLIRAGMAAALAAGVAACATQPGDIAPLHPGEFHYIATTSDGHPLLEGRLTIGIDGDSVISGSWSIHWVPGADTTTEVGPQVGSGTLVGSRSGATLVIQLNPQNADHNVGLLGISTAAGLVGEWEWVTITGPRTRGLFRATLR